jgi:hypothetical protein
MRLNSTGVSGIWAGITMTNLVLWWRIVCRSWRWLTLGKVAVVVDRAFFREAQVFNLFLQSFYVQYIQLMLSTTEIIVMHTSTLYTRYM